MTVTHHNDTQDGSQNGTQNDSEISLIHLFRLEVASQMDMLNNHLLSLEKEGTPDTDMLDALMRAAHSIKGAARIVQIEPVVKVAHSLEDFFMVTRQGILQLSSDHVDVLLLASDFIQRISLLDEVVLLEQAETYEADANTIVLSIEGVLAGALKAQTEVEVEASGAAVSDAEVSGAEGADIEGADIEGLEITDAMISSPVDSNSVNSSPVDSKPVVSKPVISKPAILKPISLEVSEPVAAAQPDKTASVQTSAVGVDKAGQARMIRMSADNLNRLMGLAGESLVESNWLQPFSATLLQLKKQQKGVLSLLQRFEQQEVKAEGKVERKVEEKAILPMTTQRLEQQPSIEISEAIQALQACHELLSDQLSDLDLFSRRFGQLSDRLYREVIASHMCAFEMGTRGYARLVRDLSKSMGKQVSLEIKGLMTQVDRDILEKLDAPITHLLTNAIAHGLERPEARLAAGKPAEGEICIEAVHRSGLLRITVEDDGAGINFDALKQKIVHKGMTPESVVNQLSEAELIEFLFLPGFSTTAQVDQVAGRGYGLDIARSMVQSFGGALQATVIRKSARGAICGTRFQFQLPLTLSVVRSLLLEIADEPYAISLSRISRVLRLHHTQICYSENRPYFSLEGDDHTPTENISLVCARQLLALPDGSPVQSGAAAETWVIVIGEIGNRYGLCVDRVIEEKDLVVRPLDKRLGKVPNVSSAALTEKGDPILILDVVDMLQAAANLSAKLSTGKAVSSTAFATTAPLDAEPLDISSSSVSKVKKVLVVDDSL
ncbi:MAG: chemotaxis protein CheA, partial [Cyanobacteria bacterium J06643_4]